MDRPKQEKIIKQGQLKHKDTAIRFALERWKLRTAVLKSLPTGRLQFVLLDGKGVEKYHVPIEEYSGIYINPKADGNEKYSCALLTEHTTDVFAFESPEAMNNWVDVIQEKLGRVLSVNITVPYRQHQLKQGLAMLLLRDNAIAITTTDQPPKVQCAFLIRHIKKYGDFDDGFVFETGNKCPKGEKTYLIRCTNNRKLYGLLDGLANRSTTIRDIILKQKFSEIAVFQGSKVLVSPNLPSFNFGKPSSQLRVQSREHGHGLKGVPGNRSSSVVVGGSHAKYPVQSDSSLPYYNMETSEKNYLNVGPNGQSIVPEVEYEIIPDDSVFKEDKGIRPKRGSMPLSKGIDHSYRHLQSERTKSSTMAVQKARRYQSDSSYMNVDIPVATVALPGDRDSYVNFEPIGSQTSTVADSYVNFEPAFLSGAKDHHDSTTEYANVDFTMKKCEHDAHKSPSSDVIDGNSDVFADPITSLPDDIAPNASRIVFHTFPSDESLDAKSVNVDEKEEDDKKFSADNEPLVSAKQTPCDYEEATLKLSNTEQTDDDMKSSTVQASHAPCDYEESLPKYLPSASTEQQPKNVRESFVPSSTTHESPALPSDYELMIPVHLHQAQDTAVVENWHVDFASKFANAAHVTKETHNISKADDDYSRLQFHHKGGDSVMVDKVNPESFIKNLDSDAPDSDTPYSMLDTSGAAKVGQHNHLSGSTKPQVPPRHLKKNLKLFEPSSDFNTLIPPLPPRNPNLQQTLRSSPPVPPAGPKPATFPNPAVPSSQIAPQLNYTELHFTDIGQHRFRARSKHLDPTLPQEKSNYAVIDRDACVGMQVALEQKKHDRQS